MTNRNQIWKCNVCGNIVEVLHEGADALVCCEKPMILMEANSVDAVAPKGVPTAQVASDKSDEVVKKHVPVIEGSRVSVGSEPHPMTEDHYIEWIELTMDTGRTIRKFLKPGVLGGHDSGEPDKPILEFCCGVVSARCYCNLHGLWSNSNL